MEENTSAKKFTVEDIGEAFKNMFSACNYCAHRDVCKKVYEERKPNEFCQDFLGNEDYTRYSAINEMFQPIFKWMQHHYPHGDTRFIVDNSSAKMMIEYGAYAYDKKMYSSIEPPKHGSWIEKDGKQFCSVCQGVVAESKDENTMEYRLYHHCPFCGAIMDGKAIEN